MANGTETLNADPSVAAGHTTGIPHQPGAPAAESIPEMSYEDAMARSAAYLESLGFDSTLPANRVEADFERRHLEHEHDMASQEAYGAALALDAHNRKQEAHAARIGTEDEALFSDPVTAQAVRHEQIGRDAEERFRTEHSALASHDELDPLDKLVQARFNMAAKEAGRRAVDTHRAEIDSEVKRMRAEKAAVAERQRIEEESYKARQERDQLFFDGERADDWDKKVQALDAAFEYALAHEDDPRAMDDYNTYWGRMRAGERKAYDAYRKEIENPTTEPVEPDQPEPGTPPAPAPVEPDQGGRRRRLRWPRRRGEPTTEEGDAGDQNPPTRRRRAPAGDDEPRPRGRAARRQRRHERADEEIPAYQRPEGAGRFSRETRQHWLNTRRRQLGQVMLQMRGYGTQPEGEFLDEPGMAERHLDRYGLHVPERQPQEYREPATQRDTLARQQMERLYAPLRAGAPGREDERNGETAEEFKARMDALYAEDPDYWRTQTYDQLSEHFNLGEMSNQLEAGFAEDNGHSYNRRRLLRNIRRDFQISRREANALIENLVEQGVLSEAGNGELIYGATANAEADEEQA